MGLWDLLETCEPLKACFCCFFFSGGDLRFVYVDISGLFLRIFFEPNSMMKCNKGSEL